MAAIQEAERNTSGEIRIHLENRTKPDRSIMLQAAKAFNHLGMDDTEQHNGVMIYFAVEDQRFAILADRGINEVVPAGFWNDIAQQMSERFKREEFVQGLTEGVHAIGEQLKQYFPYQADDINELPDEISYG